MSTRAVRRAAIGRGAHVAWRRHDGIGADIFQAVAPLFGRLRPPARHQRRLLVGRQMAEAFEGRMQALTLLGREFLEAVHVLPRRGPLLGRHRLPTLNPLADRRLAVGRQMRPLVRPFEKVLLPPSG